jgi:hypothetical protein
MNNIKGDLIECVDTIISNLQSEAEGLTEKEENKTGSKSDTLVSSERSCAATQTAF